MRRRRSWDVIKTEIEHHYPFLSFLVAITYLDLEDFKLVFLDLKESPLLITFRPDVAKFLSRYNSLELS